MGFNAILKTKRVYMLYLLPFILAAIAFLRFYFRTGRFFRLFGFGRYFNSGFSRTRRVVVEGNWCVGFAVFVISGIFCCGQI